MTVHLLPGLHYSTLYEYCLLGCLWYLTSASNQANPGLGQHRR